ncbi:MAG: hypothetical protein LBU51_03100 [Bacteroidales bacterium]|jgi:hypothetical protein|nr:hypothetical protein [Bacteroidales bacterium]
MNSVSPPPIEFDKTISQIDRDRYQGLYDCFIKAAKEYEKEHGTTFIIGTERRCRPHFEGNGNGRGVIVTFFTESMDTSFNHLGFNINQEKRTRAPYHYWFNTQLAMQRVGVGFGLVSSATTINELNRILEANKWSNFRFERANQGPILLKNEVPINGRELSDVTASIKAELDNILKKSEEGLAKLGVQTGQHLTKKKEYK